MMEKQMLTLLALLSIIIMGSCTQASLLQGERWVYIGRQDVNFDSERNEIPARGYDAYTAVRFYITKTAITILDIQVTLEDNNNIEVSVQNTVTPGNRSRIISLPRFNSRIKSIAFTYRNAGNKLSKRAVVKLYGLRVE